MPRKTELSRLTWTPEYRTALKKLVEDNEELSQKLPAEHFWRLIASLMGEAFPDVDWGWKQCSAQWGRRAQWGDTGKKRSGSARKLPLEAIRKAAQEAVQEELEPIQGMLLENSIKLESIEKALARLVQTLTERPESEKAGGDE